MKFLLIFLQIKMLTFGHHLSDPVMLLTV